MSEKVPEVNLADFSQRLNDKLYEELLDLLLIFKKFLTEGAPKLKAVMDSPERLAFTKVALSISNILLQDIAWCAAFKGYKNGELTLEQTMSTYGDLKEEFDLETPHKSLAFFSGKIYNLHSRILDFIRSYK